jgi:hypothetical protein
MNFKIVLIGLLVVITGALVVARSNALLLHEDHPERTATVYKTATCGCCANYVSYLRTKNFDVKIVDLTDEELTEKKHQLGVAHELNSCHTTVASAGERDYFIEGHIPYEAVEKLLGEKPLIKGIGTPGMPSASPGMPGTKTEPFNISQVKNDVQTAPYLTL